ncbi:ribonuclease II, chloroplastic/mitochondrial isoform X2 [Diospyros lotus]|uniref:ribonuclease II, chloroplastic/mitochondrial isoform X2 n=1 Tax=Diospyros lotus TaxID=55363 RepID=UPI0022571E61|nr:ribonuclease II, chloroplastic/mitochondrial isoform X2 [Diospyros lotus]
MAVRAMNTYSIFRSVPSPPLAALGSCLHHFTASQWRPHAKIGFRLPNFRSGQAGLLGYGSVRSYSSESLVESVMEELGSLRKRKRICASAKVGLTNSGELLEDKLERKALQKGLLLEFKKDSERVLLAVAQRPDGKKNWMVSDQDPSLLEYAWVELLEKNKSVTVMDLAEMIFGSAEPLESYCAHLLLSKDEIYFTVLESKGSFSFYGPRPASQVEELLRRKLAKETAEREFEEFVQLLKSAKSMPPHAKPSKSSWEVEENIRNRIKSLENYAIDACENGEQKKTAGMILRALGLSKTSASALNLLIVIGYFPVHVNLDLLKFNIRTDHSDEIISAAECLLSGSSDPDEVDRIDLTHLKVYAIDVDEADELDDALSATRLNDGRIKVWIHVADPTSLVQPRSIVDGEALKRGTSVFLPTATYPMFPEKLAMEGMSLKQGKLCKAVTVSVVLHSDGSIAEYSVNNSIIKPTYMLTYESASELLYLNLEEEVELRILSEAAALRLQWRREQGAIDTATLETRIKVVNPDDPEPSINIYVENQADPAMRLVSEMMILCGEAVATFGSSNNIPLPFRGQPQSNIDVSAFSHLPEGPVRSSAIIKIMRAAEMDFRKPIRHGLLGIPGYVQFTSPIRRYMDLLAHYQVKAFLRGDSPPFSAGQLEGKASVINMNTRIIRRVCSSSLWYWILEYLRRQPKEARFRALVLRFIKDRLAAILLLDVGTQASAWVSVGVQIGDEVKVQVEEAHPRDDVLSLKEVVQVV